MTGYGVHMSRCQESRTLNAREVLRFNRTIQHRDSLVIGYSGAYEVDLAISDFREGVVSSLGYPSYQIFRKEVLRVIHSILMPRGRGLSAMQRAPCVPTPASMAEFHQSALRVSSGIASTSDSQRKSCRQNIVRKRRPGRLV